MKIQRRIKTGAGFALRIRADPIGDDAGLADDGSEQSLAHGAGDNVRRLSSAMVLVRHLSELRPSNLSDRRGMPVG